MDVGSNSTTFVLQRKVFIADPLVHLTTDDSNFNFELNANNKLWCKFDLRVKTKHCFVSYNWKFAINDYAYNRDWIFEASSAYLRCCSLRDVMGWLNLKLY